jgi:hypothetical protein
MKLLFVVLSMACAAFGQAQISGNVVRFTDTSGNLITAGDNANNALRVNVVAGGASGGTSSNFGSAFPSAGTAAGFSDGTNMQTGRVFDADSGGGTQYVLGANLRRIASGGSAELIGQSSMATSLPVTIANDQTALPVSQSGTWTVQPGNTANTTPWFVRTVPLHACSGNTLQDIQQADVAITTGSNLTTADTCVFSIYIANKTATAVTATIQDRAGTPFVYSSTFTIPGNSDVTRQFSGMRFVSGVTIIAGTATSLNARLIGVQ